MHEELPRPTHFHAADKHVWVRQEPHASVRIVAQLIVQMTIFALIADMH
ncbi:MAG: hypothetical protein NVS2B12_41520 [Ktedonobacteraceae bacterium]